MPSDVQDRYLHQSLSYTAWLNPANLTTDSFQNLLLASEILRPYIIHSLFHQAQDLHSTSANELLSLTEVPKPSVLLIRFLSKKKKKSQFSRRDYGFADCTTSTLLPSECFLTGMLTPSVEEWQTKRRSVLKLLQIVYTREKQKTPSLAA